MFAKVLASLTGRFAGIKEWSASKERLAYIFGNITSSLGFQFPEKGFSPEQSARIIRMNLDDQKMCLRRVLFAMLIGYRNREINLVQDIELFGVPVIINYGRAAKFLMVNDFYNDHGIVPKVPVFEESRDFPWLEYLDRVAYLHSCITDTLFARKDEALAFILDNLADLPEAFNFPKWQAAGFSRDMPDQNYPSPYRSLYRYSSKVDAESLEREERPRQAQRRLVCSSGSGSGSGSSSSSSSSSRRPANKVVYLVSSDDDEELPETSKQPSVKRERSSSKEFSSKRVRSSTSSSTSSLYSAGNNDRP